MNKSTKQRNMELIGLSEGVKLKSLKNDSFKQLSESYQEQKEDVDTTVEKFEQKTFEAREEDKVLYNLTDDMIEIEI